MLRCPLLSPAQAPSLHGPAPWTLLTEGGVAGHVALGRALCPLHHVFKALLHCSLWGAPFLPTAGGPVGGAATLCSSVRPWSDRHRVCPLLKRMLRQAPEMAEGQRPVPWRSRWPSASRHGFPWPRRGGRGQWPPLWPPPCSPPHVQSSNQELTFGERGPERKDDRDFVFAHWFCTDVYKIHMYL